MSLRASLYLLFAASLILVAAAGVAPADEIVTAPSDDVVATDAADDSEVAPAEEAESPADDASTSGESDSEPIDLFEAIDEGLVEVKFIARDDHRGRVIVENKTDEEVQFRMPEAFVGVPVLAQLGGGGGGAFSVAPEKAAKINVPLLCLDHGVRIPSSKKPYKIVPADEHLSSQPEVIELLAAFGRGELQRDAAQAAVWHTNSDVSWTELAAKLDGTVRSTVRNSYFTQYELQAAIAYVQEAVRRAAERKPSEATSDDAESMSEEGMTDRRSYDAEQEG